MNSVRNTIAAIIVVFLLMGCVSKPKVKRLAPTVIPETLYISKPWAYHPPTDIFRRVSAITGAIQNANSAISQSINTQMQIQNQAVEAQNRRLYESYRQANQSYYRSQQQSNIETSQSSQSAKSNLKYIESVPTPAFRQPELSGELLTCVLQGRRNC